MSEGQSPSTALKVLFAGTPDFAAEQLEALVASPFEIVGAYSQPDRPVGRGKKLKPTPVKAVAEANGIPVFQPTTLKTPEVQAELAALGADVMIVVAYGMILPQAVLDIPRLGCVNVHASLLPRWRGAAPIERAIEAGDVETGITIMQMDAGLDTGDMLCKVSCPIDSETTGDSLRATLSDLGRQSLVATLEQMAQGNHKGEVQDDSLSNYAPKLNKTEAVLDWQLTASELDLKVRAFNSAMITYGVLDGERIKIWQAKPQADNKGAAPGTILSADKNGIAIACGEGALLITKLQLPGGKALDCQAVLNSRAAMFAPGTCFEGAAVGG